MTRMASGIFRRNDRVAVAPGTTVRVIAGNRRHGTRAYLLELGTSNLVLTGIAVPPQGTEVRIAITLPGRFVEFELPGNVTWQRSGDFCVEFAELSDRQVYALSLARELSQSSRAPSSANETTLAPRTATIRPSTPPARISAK